jgi:endonuclease/exonuclease/phosphatase family metal-dependent hydrolase
MKIYSWNMYFRNAVPDRALEFIQLLDFDVLCLQEVSEDFLARLKALPYPIAVGADVDRLFSRGTDRNYLVILSKHPIIQTKAFALPIAPAPLRTRLFIQLMRIARWSRVANHGGLRATIATPEFPGGIQIFSLHILLSNPGDRAAEFEHVMHERDTNIPAVVCGDFNLIDSPKLSILNWILGGSVGDAIHYDRERRSMEDRFALHDLMNPLRGKITHPFSRSQLDHILISTSLRARNARVVDERPGSDHSPICVECTA